MSDAFSNALQKLTERQQHPASCCPDTSSADARPDDAAAVSGLKAAAYGECDHTIADEHRLRSWLDTFTATAHFALTPPATPHAQPRREVEPECPTILQHPCAVPNNSAKNMSRREPLISTPPVPHPQPVLSTPQIQPTLQAERAPAYPVIHPEPEPAVPTVKMSTPPAASVTKYTATFASTPAGRLLARVSQSGTANWQKHVESILENRRHAAAAVVAVCVAVLWLAAPTTPKSESIPPSEVSDMDSILAEFDSADQQKPEPAEPLNSSFEDAVIPQTADASSPIREFDTDAIRASSDQNSGSAVHDGSNLFLATPTTSPTEDDASDQKVRVRLTKSITPLN